MVVVDGAKKFGMAAVALNKIVPFPDKKYDFNLTHVLLFSLLLAILSMVHHPAQDDIEKKEKDRKEAEKKKEKKKGR
eukprot:CAMPEP_0169122824 /NCGR_PEP_ID=MMETSP1015-20121227/33443_1 /TAXON_ID=342587 /ORGANISM="Karlodinium micrum, Strain CCMP2283" /LENGTH=76 /DNA_ID=CAMNT_0009186091 /DNA_START=160 /DNA_END=390 /DNA_ORIENTATION=+